MDKSLIYSGKATIEDLLTLHDLGFEFVLEDGTIAAILHD